MAPLRRGFFLSEQTAPITVGCVALWELAAFALWPSAGSRVREEREVNGGDNRPHKGPEGLAMVQVREKSRFGPCYALGELIGETATRYIYSNRAGTAFVSKSSSIHLAPCAVCADYQESDEAA
jgi:hypothetical protein